MKFLIASIVLIAKVIWIPFAFLVTTAWDFAKAVWPVLATVNKTSNKAEAERVTILAPDDPFNPTDEYLEVRGRF